MKIWKKNRLWLLLLLIMIESCIGQNSCGKPKKACEQLEGMCENKKYKDTCVEYQGRVLSGKKYCGNSKTCYCCAPGCRKPKKACEELGGMCENKKNKDSCVEDGGKVFSGKKYCHNSKTCFCCAFDPYGSTPPPPYGSTISPYGSTDTPPYGSTFTSPYGSTYEPCPYQGCPTDFFLPFGYNQIFKLFAETSDWETAKSKCEDAGLILAEPTVEVIEFLKRFLLTLCSDVLQGQANIWVGVRGDGEKFLWQSSQTEFNVSLLGNWQPGFSIASTGLCIAMRTDDNHIVYPNIYLRWPYDPYSCNQSNLYRLCEVPTTK